MAYLTLLITCGKPVQSCELTVNNFFAILLEKIDMAIVNGPLLSVSARGHLGDDIYYSEWKGKPVVAGIRLSKKYKFWLTQKKFFSQTEGQQAIRGTFKKALIEWRKLNPFEKQIYKDLSKKVKNTAVGLFVQNWIDDFYNRNEFKQRWLFSLGLGSNLFLFKPEYIESYLVNRFIKK